MNILETLKESIVVERKIKQRGTDQFFLRKWHLPSENIKFYYRKKDKQDGIPERAGFEKQLTAESGYILLGALSSDYEVRFKGLPADPSKHVEHPNVLKLFTTNSIEKIFFINEKNDLRELLRPWYTGNLVIRNLDELEAMGKEIWEQVLEPLLEKRESVAVAETNKEGQPESAIPSSAEKLPSYDESLTTRITEGGVKKTFSTTYERDQRLRREALKINGYSCLACGFNFEDHYGQVGKDFIEVHHMIPLAEGERESDPNNLIPLCSNCHRMIHRLYNKIEDRDKALDVLKEVIQQSK